MTDLFCKYIHYDLMTLKSRFDNSEADFLNI